MVNLLTITTKEIGRFTGANFKMGGHIKSPIANTASAALTITEALNPGNNERINPVDESISQ